MSKLCSVVFTGKLLPNTDPDTAAKKFASVFKVPEEKALKLIQDGQEKALKKDVDPAAAAHYRDVLTDIGLQTRLDTPADPAAATTGAGGPIGQCPKCASTQIENGICKSCGILIEAYLANQAAARKAETAPPTPPEPPPRLGMPAASGADPDASGPMIGEPIEARPTPDPHGAAAGQGLSWIKAGWELFKAAPLVWIISLVLFMAIVSVVSLIPVLGGLASGLLSPILTAGFMIGAHNLRHGEEFRIGDLFTGFSRQTGSLAAVGALYMAGYLLIGITIALVLIGPMMAAAGTTGGLDPQTLNNLDEQQAEILIQALGPNFLLIMLLAVALAIPLMMAYWFAPVLVIVDEVPAMTAMKLSFLACLRNILPFLVYGLVSMLLFIIAAIPFLLGLLVLSPVMIASMYAAYEDIFFDNGQLL